MGGNSAVCCLSLTDRSGRINSSILRLAVRSGAPMTVETLSVAGSGAAWTGERRCPVTHPSGIPAFEAGEFRDVTVAEDTQQFCS